MTPPVVAFAGCGMPAATIDDARVVLKHTFGYDDFRPNQIDVVKAVVAGHDTLGVLPTGGGKSLCYQVPALVREGLTVVISPLISLMKDQVDRLVSRNVDATYLNSTLGDVETATRLQRIAHGSVKLLYVAPERLESPDLIRRLKLCGVALLAVDEAHCISEWGHEFRPSFRRLSAARDGLGTPQTIALTATATPNVRRDIATQLHLRSPIVIVGGFDRTNLDYTVHRCESDTAREGALVRILKSHERPAIVYAPTRAAVESVSRRLTRAGIRTLPYHGGLSDFARAEVQDDFMHDRVDTIAATNAFGMGIDKPNVRLVVHWAMPGTLEAYYQEAGRAGRDGAPARCVLLHHDGDRTTHEWFIRGSFPPYDVVLDVCHALAGMGEHDRITSSPGMIARMCHKAGAREVRAVLGLLEREGALLPPEHSSIIWLRLLATPVRIRRELGADAEEIGLLRRLWRIGSDRLSEGTVVSVEQLAPMKMRTIRHVLGKLRERQFVDFVVESQDYRVDPDFDLEVPDLPWQRLEQRRLAELKRLDAMDGYTTTSRCRRAFVLGYFGERDTPERCGACDNCRRPAVSNTG